MMASCFPLARDRTEMENAAACRVLMLLACTALLCSGSLGHDAAATDGGQNISVAEARHHVSSGPAGGRSLAQEAAPSSTVLPLAHTGTLRSSQAGSSASPFPDSLEHISLSEPHPPSLESSEKGGAEDQTKATTSRGSSEKGGAEDWTRPTNARGSSEKTRPGAAPQRDVLVGRCLLTIAVMAAVSSVFIISTICLATRLSEFRRRGRGQLQDTEMVCISALMNDTDHPIPTRLPRSNGALIPDGDHLTLDSFLPL